MDSTQLPALDLYALAATALYLLVVILLAGAMMVRLALEFDATRRAMSRADVAMMGGLAGVQLVMVVVAAAMLAWVPEVRLLALAVIGNTLMVVCVLVVYPVAMARDRMGVGPPCGAMSAPLFAGRSWWAAGAMALGFILLWSMVWLGGMQAVGVEFKAAESLDVLAKNPLSWVLLVPIALMAAFIEEILFRLGLQGALSEMLGDRDPRGTWAIMITSAVWALGHAANMTPHGWKEVHIFVIGLVLGRLMQAHGLRAAIAAHLGLNALAVAASGAALLLGLEE